MKAIARIGLAAALVGTLVIGVHAALAGNHPASPGSAGPESIVAFASRTAAVTLRDVPFFFLGNFLVAYAKWQPLFWTLIAAGLVAAAAHRQWSIAALAMSLLPIAVYRNAFPYFYVLMMAPASVLAGFAIHSILAYVRPKATQLATAALVAVFLAGLVYQGIRPMGRLWPDNQSVQREILAGVHQIFPEPVNYIDRCGMVASFRKVNFFMSTWGVAAYRSRGVPFTDMVMPTAKPAFVLVNTPLLGGDHESIGGLLPQDREALEQSYVWYWGPIKVAGGIARIARGGTAEIKVPFAHNYRVQSAEPVVIAGVERRSGDVLHVGDRVSVHVPQGAPSDFVIVALTIASAQPAPVAEVLARPIFTGL